MVHKPWPTWLLAWHPVPTLVVRGSEFKTTYGPMTLQCQRQYFLPVFFHIPTPVLLFATGTTTVHDERERYVSPRSV
jgi:hypothetical protein